MLSFHRYLYKKGFPIPQLMESGNKSFAEFEGRFYYLQRFIIGEAYGGHPEEVANAGRHLGHMHILSERLFQEIPAYRDGRFRENPFQLARSMMDVLKQVQNLDETENKNPGIPLLKNFYREGQRFVDKIETQVGKEFHQSIFQVHGDYNPFNLLFGKQRDVIATFDLENTAVDNPCHDIAEAVLDFCFNRYRPNSTNFAGLPGFFDKEKAITFLSAYNDVNPRIYEKVKAFLPGVGGAIFIELYTLGLVREDLAIDTIPSALQIKEKIVREFKEVIQ
jgi:Ser/Thr protein kinase RdoA (MazF antagonist)